jgi:hypothetical protein
MKVLVHLVKVKAKAVQVPKEIFLTNIKKDFFLEKTEPGKKAVSYATLYDQSY